MESSIFIFRTLLFIPLFFAVVFGVTGLLLRLIRLTRFPGFASRYDSELGFLNRELRIIALIIAGLFVLVPTGIGIYLVASENAVATETERIDTVSDSVPPESIRTPGSRSLTAPHEQPVVPSGVPGAPAAPTTPSSVALPSPAPGPPPVPHAHNRSLQELIPLDPAPFVVRETRRIGPSALASGAWRGLVEPVDALFVHAHPDDESLDFAILMAALARRGWRIATLLLTDGESGLDRYPDRAAIPGYPERRLVGDALRTVRVQETQRALSILGSDYYIRPGLVNQPYNRIADERQLEEVLRIWGGKESVARTVSELIEALEPRLIVAPDRASEAREHFEHEATGYIVRAAVEAVRAGERAPSGYLVSVDPFQREVYPDAIAVPKLLGKEDLWPVQRAALSQHHTQADASVIGIRRLADLSSEYYYSVFWDFDQSLAELLDTTYAARSR